MISSSQRPVVCRLGKLLDQRSEFGFGCWGDPLELSIVAECAPGALVAADVDQEIKPLLGNVGANCRVRDRRQKRPRKLVELLAFRLECQQVSELLVANRLVGFRPLLGRSPSRFVDRLGAS